MDELARGADDPLAVDAARRVIERAREEIRAGSDPGDLGERLRAELEEARRPRLRRVLNATGVIVHTNLGRAPLPDGRRRARARHGRRATRTSSTTSTPARGDRVRTTSSRSCAG